jgi:ketosteroid isomerase-like protein
MKKSVTMLLLLLTMAVLFSTVALTQAKDNDAVAAITKMENDAVKADLAGDSSFYEKNLADDWTGGTSLGTWYTKQSLLAELKDTKNNKTNSEQLSELKVRVNGDVAVANYKTTYDSMIRGKHVARTVLSTDVFQKQDGAWKQISSHSSEAAK